MILGICGEQINEAFNFFGRTGNVNSGKVAVTGHSLGGALADIISARYGVKGVSFNSAPFLDIAYTYFPAEMTSNFTGVDDYNFLAYVNKADIFIGDYFLNEHIKPKIVLDHNLDWSLDFLNWNQYWRIDLKSDWINWISHMLPTLVTRDTNGKPCLTQIINSRIPQSVVKQVSSVVRLQLGTSRRDTITPLFRFPILDYTKELFDIDTTEYDTRINASYGGNGYDTIIGSQLGDIISGGKDGADMDGQWGNDTYFIHKGDAGSTIHDVAGQDVVILCGFDSDEEIVYQATDKFVSIMVNGEIVVNVQRNRSSCKDKDWNSFIIRRDDASLGINIEEDLETTKCYEKSFSIGCPVNIEIYDEATGEVVYTDQDGEVGAYYTDYGNFYVFPENEEGTEFVKQVDLVQGYAIRIVGYDNGTMTIDSYDTNGSSLYNELAASGIEVTPTMTATIEEIGEQKNLVIDYDGDGVTDSVVPLAVPVVVSFDANGGTGEMAEVSVAAGGAYELPECGFIAPEGQTFQGWDVNGTVCAPGEKVTVTEDVTVKALWSAASGEVTPPSGEPGGSQTPPEPSDLPLPPVVPPSSSEQTGSTAPSTTPEGPAKTGDFSAPALWAGMMAVSALVIMLILPRKNKHE